MSSPRCIMGLVAGLATGCFSGEGTIGAICRDGADCGAGQTCRNEVCGLCGDGVGQRGELCFGEPASLSDAAGAFALRTADLDGDTRDDVVAWSAGVDTLDVYLVDPRGRLVASALALADAIVDADAADIDGDGAVDVAVLHADRVVVAYGDGTGALMAPVEVDVASGAAGLAALPMSGGTGRIAVVEGAGLRWWSIDAGRGVVSTGSATVQGGTPRLSRAVALDDDGTPDLVVGTADGRLTPWLAASDGFVAGTAVDVGATPDRVVASDIDADGRTDAVALGADGSIGTTLSDGFGALVADESFDVAGAATGFAAIDLTRDGRRDYVVSTDAGVTIFVARGREHPDGVALEDAGSATDVWATDLDGDQRVELVFGGGEGLTGQEVTP